MTTVGALLFVFAVNLVIAPLGLYTGGFVGIGQLISYCLDHFLGISFPGVDISGFAYFALNAPLFLMAYQYLSKQFFFKTVYTVVLQTALLSFVPIPSHSITEDMLTNCIIGGVIAGIGVGIVLRAGSSGGGPDILGVYLAKKIPDSSVGKITLLVNGLLYGCCALLFDIEIVVYSLIYTFVMSMLIDKVHVQNINTTVLMFSKKAGLEDFVIQETRRGITIWKGQGGYTKEETNIGMVALSKYEIPVLRAKLAEFDKDAFIVVTEGNGIYGNFEKRLE